MIISDIRKSARESLKGKWKTAILITLLYTAFSFSLSFMGNFLKGLNSLIGVATAIISLPISFGIIISFMKLKRNEDVKVYDFFTLGLSNFARVWKITGNMLLKMWLPILLYILATIAFVFYVSFGTMYLFAAKSATLISILSFVGIALFIASFIYLFVTSIKYSLSYFIAYDNESLTPKEVVESSDSLIKGYKGKYILLELSFIGWGILSIFTFYIGLLWLIPYIQISEICFYEYLKENKDSEIK